jgi:hypothetical protein
MIPPRATDAEFTRYVRNITTAWDAATPGQLARGRAWYPVAHDLAGLIAGGDVRTGAGILAALSANTGWDRTVTLARQCAAGDVHGHLPDALAKVTAILAGADPASVLPMDVKTGSFYRCILDPDDPGAVVIDRHAHDIAVGEICGNRERGLSNRTRYATLAQAYRHAAQELGELPQVVQAVTWVAHIETSR